MWEETKELNDLRWDWLESLKVGSEVFWHDPDNNISSGIYRIVDINSETGYIETGDDIIYITNGASDAEVIPSEIGPVDDPSKFFMK